jgi:hypothetical protein
MWLDRRVSGWVDFAVVTGGATAALLGLLFVSVTLRIDVIVRREELQARASQTLSLLLVGLLVAVLLVVPQHLRALGVELIALAVLAAAILLHLERQVRGSGTFRRTADLTTPNVTTCAFVVTAGCVLAAGSRDGLYFLVPAIVAVLAGCGLNAWLLLLRLSDD